MAKVSIYLNFQGKTEEAFNFYKSAFKTEFSAPIMKMGDMPAPEGMGHHTKIGNNTTINLEPDTREETERLFQVLSEGATEMAPLAEQFWGALWGCCLDKYGIRWMFNFPLKK